MVTVQTRKIHFQALFRGTAASAGKSGDVGTFRNRRQLHGGDVRGLDEGSQERARLVGRLLPGIAIHRTTHGRNGLTT